jgi:hypothetical protein
MILALTAGKDLAYLDRADSAGFWAKVKAVVLAVLAALSDSAALEVKVVPVVSSAMTSELTAASAEDSSVIMITVWVALAALAA